MLESESISTRMHPAAASFAAFRCESRSVTTSRRSVLTSDLASGRGQKPYNILHSGKLSIPDPRVGQLPKPLAVLVCVHEMIRSLSQLNTSPSCHFNEEGTGGPCEAAYLSQSSTKHLTLGDVVLPKVIVLCS